MAVIGIDNGTSGTIGFICGAEYEFLETPVIIKLDFTKTKKKQIKRLDVDVFHKLMQSYITKAERNNEALMCYLERPLINPMLFNTSILAVRCFEAELTVIEALKIPYEIIDSKAWQKVLLPEGISAKGKDKKAVKNELKFASMEVAIRYFPKCEKLIRKHKDGDGILIARYGKLKEGENK